MNRYRELVRNYQNEKRKKNILAAAVVVSLSYDHYSRAYDNAYETNHSVSPHSVVMKFEVIITC